MADIRSSQGGSATRPGLPASRSAGVEALDAVVLDPRHDPEPADWQEFRASHGMPAPWDYALLRTEAGPAPHPTLLTLIRSRHRLLAAFAAIAAPLTRFGPQVADVHLSWLSGVPSWVADQDLAPAARQSLVSAFERTICRRLGPRCAGVIHRNVPPELLPLVSGRGRRVRPTVPTSVLDVGFTDMEGWLATLTRSRRNSVRRQLRFVCEDDDLQVRLGPGRDDLDGAELVALLRRHRARFAPIPNDRRAPLTGAYLHELVRRADVATLTYRATGGRLLAFATLLDSPGTLFFQHWAALLPEEGGRKHLFYDAHARAVRHAIEQARPQVSSGRGLPEVKAPLGFTPRPLFDVAVPRPVCGRAGR